MREPTIARNYAEALLELAGAADDLRGWGLLIDEIANAMENDRRLRVFLETPRVSGAEKNRILGTAFEGALPHTLVRFLQALVKNRRQMLIPQIAHEYHDLVDQVEGRIHASVTTAKEVDDAERKVIAEQLSRAIGKEVVPHYHVNAQILGGMVARIGDTVMDGSVRRRLATLRGRMISGRV